MSIEILQTKFYMPGSSVRDGRSLLVSRQRLIQKLNDGLASNLITVCAPAGFGKSTLLGAWAMQHAQMDEVAWLSLDEDDNDPIRFWAHFVAALQRVDATIGATMVSLLQSSQPLPVKTLLTALLNDLNARSEQSIVVLDDYHVISASAIHKGLLFLLAHMPPQLHLIVSSRTDPPWPLARWRAQNLLTEVRADDLRFTLEEAAIFLQEVMGLELSAAEISALDKRTEGWVAGLQLVALSLRGVTDSAHFIRAFSGTNRYIVDYLVEEVLARQREEVQQFLLQSSLLERLCGPLCDAVVEQRAGFSLESQEILEQLEHDNLFLIALDEERTWYRYHHLFGEVLQHRLRRSHADVIPHVHRRASEWFLQQNMMVEAIHHALEATDYERATVLIEQVGIADFALPHMQRSLKRWLELLPAEVVFDRPRLCLINALIFFVQVKISAALQWIEFATSALARARSQFAGEAAHDEIAGEIAALRAMSIAYHPDYRIDDALALSQQTLATLKDTQPTFRCLAAFALALARLKQGDVAAAEQALVEANRNGQAAGNAYLVGTAVSILAATQRAQGDLHRALATCQGTLAWASQRAVAGYPVFGGVHLNLAEVCREQNRLDAALHHVEQAIARGNRANDPSNWIICHLVLLRVHQGLGEWETAHTLLRQLGEWIEQHPSIVDGSLLPAMCAQFQVAEAAGSDDALLHEAWAWAEGAQWEEGELVAASRFFEYVYLYEHRRIARVQVFLAWARVHGDRQLVHEALAYLERQLPIAQAARIHWFQVKIHLLRALALDILDASAEIDLTLHQALRLAQPQGYVRIFVDEGEAMRDLLVKARNQSTEPQLAAYADQLLDAFPFIAPSPSQPTPHLPAFAPGLVEQLTERELEILRLVNDGLSNREIATTLIVSLGTIKKHLNNIFGKLGVHSRTQALVTARKLHLI